MAIIELEVMKREQTRKEACKKYRREGLIPAILYGQENNEKFLVNSKVFAKLYPRLNKATVLQLKEKNKNYEVLIKECCKNELKNEFVHIDFYELKKGKRLHTSIPLRLTGNAIGIREGGIMERLIDAVEVECLPKDIVDHIDVPVESLKINETLHIKDVKLDEKKYKILTDLDEVIVKISGKVTEAEESETSEDEEENDEKGPHAGRVDERRWKKKKRDGRMGAG